MKRRVVLRRRTLRRRSQKDRSTWERISRLARDYLPPPRILYASQTAIGLIAVLLAFVLPDGWLSGAGYFYFSIAAYYWIAHAIFGRQLRALRARIASEGRAFAQTELDSSTGRRI